MKTLLIALVATLTANAQVPPPILRLLRNGGPSPRLYSNAGAAIQVLGMGAMTGVGETWLIEQHPSFQSIEDLDKALRGASFDPSRRTDGVLEDEVLGPARTLIAFYRDGWGYHAEEAVRMLPRARYFNVTIYRLRPGANVDVQSFMNQRRQNLDSMNTTQPDLVYHVISGASSDLYLVLAPMVSLRSMDERIARLPLETRFQQPDGELGRETLMFRIDPAISYVSDEFSAADTAFWRGK